MEKRFVVISLTTFGVALLIVGIYRARSKPSEFILVRHEPPLSTSMQTHGWLAGPTLMRRYSLHMCYDDAYKALNEELSPQGWKSEATYGGFMFAGPGANPDWVQVTRGRYVGRGTFEAVYTKVDKALSINAHGWIVVTTYHHLPSGSALFNHVTGPKEAWFAIGLIKPAPAAVEFDQVVDVSKGTARLEGRENYAEVDSEWPLVIGPNP